MINETFTPKQLAALAADMHTSDIVESIETTKLLQAMGHVPTAEAAAELLALRTELFARVIGGY